MIFPLVSHSSPLQDLCSQSPSDYTSEDFVFYANHKVAPVRKPIVVDGLRYRDVYLVPFRDYFSNVVAETYFNSPRQYARYRKKMNRKYSLPTISFAPDVSLWIFGTLEDPTATIFLDKDVISIAYNCDHHLE
jgi:hypothetical protein